MKLLLYRINTKTKSSKRKLRINFERVLFISFIVTFVIMVFVQAALTSPSIRASLSISDELEGTPLAMEEYLYSKGEIVLQLINSKKNESLKILVNGEEVGSFLQKNVKIKVKNGDVIEIDGSSVNEDMEIAIISKSDNIITECIGKRILVNSNIKKIVKVKIE